MPESRGKKCVFPEHFRKSGFSRELFKKKFDAISLAKCLFLKNISDKADKPDTVTRRISENAEG
jgi:hypothetical protein